MCLIEELFLGQKLLRLKKEISVHTTLLNVNTVYCHGSGCFKGCLPKLLPAINWHKCLPENTKNERL